MKKTAYYSDLLFTFFCVGIFTLCLFRFQRLSFWLSVLLAAVCGGLGAAAIGAWLRMRNKKAYLSSAGEREKAKLLLHLSLCSPEQLTARFIEAFKKTGEAAKRFSSLKLYTKDSFYYLQFGFSPLSADTVAAFFRFKTSKQRIILCKDCTPEAKTLCDVLSVQVQTGEQIYLFFKQADALPEQFLGDVPNAQKRAKRTIAFAKSNAKRFLLSGVLVLLSSLITPFAGYYILFGALLIAAALFVRIFGYT